jgi:hypothetical protein
MNKKQGENAIKINSRKNRQKNKITEPRKTLRAAEDDTGIGRRKNDKTNLIFARKVLRIPLLVRSHKSAHRHLGEKCLE